MAQVPVLPVIARLKVENMKIRVTVLLAICALLAIPTNSPSFGDEPCDTSPRDELGCDKLACDELVIGN